MINPSVRQKNDPAPAASADVSGPSRITALALAGEPERSAGSLFSDSLERVLGQAEAARVALVPAEWMGLQRVHLPVRGARQQRGALPFALEETLASPIETLHFALCGTAPGGDVLVATLSQDRMQNAIDAFSGQRLVPEALVLPTPDPISESQGSWAVWRDGARALVRVSDGTGFAARVDMLPQIWRLAGRPAVFSHGAALPGELGAQDLSGSPPEPLKSDLAVDLRQGAFAPSRGLAKPLGLLAASLVIAALAHLALAYADLRATRSLAADLRERAQATLAERLPAATIYDDPQLLLRQLSAAGGTTQGSGFLPLLDTTSWALLNAGPTVNLRRLVWAADGAALTLSVEAQGLDGLQSMEQALRVAGLSVRSGTATAGNGGAQSDLTVSMGGR